MNAHIGDFYIFFLLNLLAPLNSSSYQYRSERFYYTAYQIQILFLSSQSLISWRPYKDPLCWFDACTHTWKFLFYFYFDISFKPFGMASFAVIRMTRIPIDSTKRTNITCNVHHLKLNYVVILLKRCEKV